MKQSLWLLNSQADDEYPHRAHSGSVSVGCGSAIWRCPLVERPRKMEGSKGDSSPQTRDAESWAALVAGVAFCGYRRPGPGLASRVLVVRRKKRSFLRICPAEYGRDRDLGCSRCCCCSSPNASSKVARPGWIFLVFFSFHLRLAQRRLDCPPEVMARPAL